MVADTRETPSAARTAPEAAHSRAKRYRQIVEILARHGLGFLIGSITLDRRRILRLSPTDGTGGKQRLAPPARVRMAIEELGPTFIKLGQIVSTRGDLLPQPYLDELSKLQDSAPPIPSDQVRQLLLEELGRPVEEVFASFDMKPMASASIGQAHAATLLNGTEVVVKLRRPGVAEQVEEDLHILLDLALRASRQWEAARFYDVYAITQEFAQTLRAEMDYLREGHNLETISQNFAEEPDIHLPKVYWETTTSRMLTLERMRGFKMSDVAAIEAAGLDRPMVAKRAARLLLTMILEHGVFHADPHAGNVFVERDGTIALIDFGMIGHVDAASRELLVELMISMTRQDASQLADVMLQLGMARAYVDRNALRRDLQRLLARYMGRTLKDVKFSVFLGELLEVIRLHHLRLQPDLALLVKTLGMSEGVAAQLYPDFDLMEVYLPLAEQLVREQFSFARWSKQMALAGVDALEMSMALPRQLHRILGDIERGGFEVNIQPASFDPYLNRIEQLINRAILALLAATFTISAALLLAAYHPARWDGAVSLLFFLVVLASLLFGIYVLWKLLRARNRPS
ncbi:MAG: ABC1 kinase family protein [Ktedonobacterales bacterium]